MSALVLVEGSGAAQNPEEPPYPRRRLLLGILGRTWLWFLIGCLLVTFVPMLFGWRPYVIESESMAPRIRTGDVVLAAPLAATTPPADLVGRVIVFDDPNIPGRVVTHRTSSVTDEGALRTKGDANPQLDSQPVPLSSLHGMGRLLVRFVGLPFVWVHTGQLGWLALFVVSLVAAAWAVSRDRDPDQEPDPPAADGPPPPPPSMAPDPTPSGASQIAAAKPFTLPGGRVGRFARVLLGRATLVLAMSVVLLLPATAAAFSATSRNAGNSWSVPSYSYGTEANALGPYLYWRLDETGTATTAADASGNGRTGQYNTNGSATFFTRIADGALTTDTPDNAVSLVNAASCINTASTTLINGQNPASVVIWFRAPSSYTGGGKLAGFEKPRTGVATPSTGTYDRHLYMDGNGVVWFGVYNGGYVTVRSTGALNDGQWHMAVGTVGPAGTRLFIDGVLQQTNANTVGENVTGVWRAGCGNLGGWGGSWTGPNNPGTATGTTANRPFRADLDEFTVYANQLSAADISFLYWVR